MPLETKVEPAPPSTAGHARPTIASLRYWSFIGRWSFSPALLALTLTTTTLSLRAADAWSVRVEEPTGLYPRTNEIVAVSYTKIGGPQTAWRVLDSTGQELPWQATETALLFRATLIPGELPEYQIAPASDVKTNFTNRILLKKIGMNRVELGNRFFRVLLDTHIPAIVEAYNLRADPYRTLNLVETSPEDAAALKDDIHAANAMGFQPVPGVPEGNSGWSSLGAAGSLTNVEFIETGPLRGKVRLGRAGEAWELAWTSDSSALRWQARKGFRFTAISAAPYLPFDRCIDGSEYNWPNGPDDAEPPNHDIGPRTWSKLPGGHAVYYRNAENYGALGIVALDSDLTWTGIGTRRFVARKDTGDTELAITFPEWRGSNTVIEARCENRVLRQPLLLNVRKLESVHSSLRQPAERETEIKTEAAADAPQPFQPDSLSLDGEWELAWTEKGAGPPLSGWRPVKVPGSAHVQWLDRSKLYTHEAEWISAKEWWYRKRFAIPDRFAGKRLRLQFGATDYYADSWLNHQSLGRHEGYIDPYEWDVTSAARPGSTNELLVRVWTPVDYYWKHRPYTVKGAYGAVDQKPDDITALGITRPVRLLASDQVWIKDVAIDTRLSGSDAAEVQVEIELNVAPESPLTLDLTLSPRNFPSPDRYHVSATIAPPSPPLEEKAGESRPYLFRIPVASPRLWWTWDHGKPNLYTLEVRLRDSEGRVVDARTLAVGIREIERIGWTFYLNRKRLFLRGTNYYPHLFLSEMDRAAYERDLGLILQMNVNLIRLHCHFSNPEFYDLADESGVLIWQDFLEAWYPQDRAFSLRAASLYDPLIRCVRNHPCVAQWCTSDEEDLENYRDLTKHLAARPALLDPQRRPVVRSTGRFGDAHVYHGWYDGSIWEYTHMTEPFVSELGATALPNYETLIKFLPDAWPIRQHEDEWTFRRLQIPEAMRAWGDPGDLSLRDYIPRTQAYVSRLFQIALERSRRLKYQPAGGICHFHAIDIWPSVTMAAIDFDRVPTKVFDTVRRSFAPVCASLEYDRDHWKTGEPFHCAIWAINDHWQALPDASVRWRIIDQHGVEKHSGHWSLTMPEDSAQKLGDAEWKTGPAGAYQLRAEVLAASKPISENVFEFDVTD